jgi:hypothetical protein
MRRLPYRYTNMAKQFFIITLMLHFLLKFIIMAQIVIYKLDNFYENINIPLTLIEYALVFAALVTWFRGHKFCYSTYNDETLVYWNTFLRKEKSMKFADAKLAVFGKRGISFYSNSEDYQNNNKPMFFISFFRSGIIEAVPINKFYLALRERDDMEVLKTFKVLPGYGKAWNFLTIAYGFLAAVTFLSMSTPITVIIVLFQSH